MLFLDIMDFRLLQLEGVLNGLTVSCCVFLLFLKPSQLDEKVLLVKVKFFNLALDLDIPVSLIGQVI
jgi:hypothetical protein